jgi:hypothetical protein
MSEEYERLKMALDQANTPEGRQAAAQAMRDYLAKNPSGGMLASSGLRKSYPNTASLDSIPDRIASDPEFAKLMDRVVNKK